MRPCGTTLDDEQVRHARLVARLGGHRPRRVQNAIDQLTDLWTGPAHLHACFGGHVHWQVVPTAAEATAVAVFAADPSPGVRRAAFAALLRAGVLPADAALVIGRGLDDPEPFVRLFAARLARSAALGPDLVAPLVRRFDDRMWSVRWHACAALAPTPAAAAARDALRSSRPRSGPLEAVWAECLAALG